MAVHNLRDLKAKIDNLMKTPGNMDDYSLSHLNEVSLRIEKALDADYIYNTDALGGGGFGGFFFFKKPPEEKEAR